MYIVHCTDICILHRCNTSDICTDDTGRTINAIEPYYEISQVYVFSWPLNKTTKKYKLII